MWTITILVLWTWGLTPLWVNIVGTVICGLNVLIKCLENWSN
jgi:hypothetical protein